MHRAILTLIFHVALMAYIAVIIIAPIRHRASLTPPGTVYTYQHRILEDYYFYLMVIRQGRDGFAQFDQYTTEPTKPTAMHFFYLFLGQIAKLTGQSNIVMYYLGLTGGLLLFYLYSWKLARFLFPSPYRYVAMAIFYIASPFPATDVAFGNATISIGTSWWTNMDPYSRIVQVPHHFTGQAMLLASTYYLLLFLSKHKLPFAVAAAVASGLGILIYSVPILVFLAALGLCVLIYSLKYLMCIKPRFAQIMNLFKQIEKPALGTFIIIGTATISLFIVQNILTSPGWPWSTFLAWEANWYNHATEIYPYTLSVYLLSYGVLPLFIVPGLVTVAKKPSPRWLMILTLLIAPVIMYLAASNHFILLPKIRFVHSAPYVFAGLSATLGIKSAVAALKNKYAQAAVSLGILVIFIANVHWGIQSYWWPEMQKYETYYNTYIPRPYFAVIDYLKQNSLPFDNVFAGYAVGVYLPAYTKNNVFVGHMASTADFWAKYSQANSFFAHTMDESEAQSIFRKQNIAYVLGEEPGLAGKYKNILQLVFSADNLTLFKPIY